MPKRPATAFMLYAQDRRNIVMMNNPSKKLTDMITMIADEWKALDVKDKMPYIKDAEERQEKYCAYVKSFEDSQV